MIIPCRFALFGFLVLATQGCSGADAASSRQIAEMRREINKIQSSQDRLNERVSTLELASGGSSSSGKRADERPELEVVRLGPGDPSEDDRQRYGPLEDDSEPPTVIRAEGDRMPTVQRGSRPPKGAVDAKASQQYDEAMDLIDRKRYDDALETLAGFLVRYPGHANADNAMYWRGECYYAMGSYVRAADQFEGLLTRYPQGNKVPDALLKLGMSQRRMGEREKAAKTFEQLRKNHPNSDAASKIPRE